VITIARKRVKIRYNPYYKFEIQTTFMITAMLNDEREKWTSQKTHEKGERFSYIALGPSGKCCYSNSGHVSFPLCLIHCIPHSILYNT